MVSTDTSIADFYRVEVLIEKICILHISELRNLRWYVRCKRLDFGQRSGAEARLTRLRKIGVSAMSLRTLAGKLHEWRRYRICRRELAQLSDRELHDIGLNRSEIAYIAWKAARS
jgi:uncharacterized protein YjiS (DUF1127 family)